MATVPYRLLALAVLLTGMTAWHASRWASPSVLWLNAVTVAPQVPRPWINLASLAMDGRNDREGERLLDVAQGKIPGRSSSEQGWAVDLVSANLALIRLRQQRWSDATALVTHAPYESARWHVCRAVPVICES